MTCRLAISFAAGLLAVVTASAVPALAAADTGSCAARGGALAVSRIVEIDTASGPLYGELTKEAKEDNFLKSKEVVLTFDDGPMPWVTSSILDTLDRFCTKATFFSVGKMALAYPATLRDVVGRGHTLGAHTWSHPLNLKRLKHDKAMDEIERGFAAVSLASGGRAAPFFRFPGLSDNGPMLDALQKRSIAAFTVDVVSEDSYLSSPDAIVTKTLSRVEARQGGILLFHDIKPATAKALPTILSELVKRGYRVVHLRAKSPVQPLPELAAELQPILAKKDPPRGVAVAKAAMLPFFGATGPEKVDAAAAPSSAEAAVSTLAPPPRDRLAARDPRPRKADAEPSRDATSTGSAELQPRRKRASAASTVSLRAHRSDANDGWSARIRRERLNRTFFD